jgi:hypothetical protein
MGPYLSAPKTEKDSIIGKSKDGKVISFLVFSNFTIDRSITERLECRDGVIPWRIHIFVR